MGPILAALAAALALVLSGCAGANAATNSEGYTPPPIGHVWTIILENKSYEATFTGLNQNDYLWKTLPSYGELLRQYYGTGHFSWTTTSARSPARRPRPTTRPTARSTRTSRPAPRPPTARRTPTSGCVYPASVQTLFNQLDDAGVSWKVYNQDMGNTPTREEVYHCGIPGNPSGSGVTDPGCATPQDQYVPKHNPAAWFHSVIDNPADVRQRRAADGYRATKGHAAIPSISQDLKSIATTPAFSWITPNNCSRRARRDLQGRQPVAATRTTTRAGSTRRTCSCRSTSR